MYYSGNGTFASSSVEADIASVQSLCYDLSRLVRRIFMDVLGRTYSDENIYGTRRLDFISGKFIQIFLKVDTAKKGFLNKIL